MYPGGKNSNGVYQTIINYFPPHRNYIEGFVGSGAILKHKKRACDFNSAIDLHDEAIDNLKYLEKTIKGLSLYKGDFFEVVNDLWIDEHTLIYLDPPYRKEDRRNKRDLYKFEFDEEKHIKLLKWALELTKKRKALIIISSYQNALYDKMLKDWRREEFIMGLHNGKTATESLYLNFPVPNQLHEYTYLGKDCWDRQRIARKIKGKIAQLKRLPQYERNAILESLSLLQYSKK